jgi:hypothetical protein
MFVRSHERSIQSLPAAATVFLRTFKPIGQSTESHELNTTKDDNCKQRSSTAFTEVTMRGDAILTLRCVLIWEGRRRFSAVF